MCSIKKFQISINHPYIHWKPYGDLFEINWYWIGIIPNKNISKIIINRTVKLLPKLYMVKKEYYFMCNNLIFSGGEYMKLIKTVYIYVKYY